MVSDMECTTGKRATTFEELINDIDELHLLKVKLSRTGSDHNWNSSKLCGLSSLHSRSKFNVVHTLWSICPVPTLKWRTKYKIVIIKQTLSAAYRSTQPLIVNFSNVHMIIIENLLGFNFSDRAFVLCSWKKANICKLTHGNFNFFHRSIWIIGNVNVYGYRFTMMV